MTTDFDIVIIGAGLAGLTTALACAHSGASVAVFDNRAITPGKDPRASALSAASLRLFENLSIDLSADLQPIQDMLVTEGAPDSPWRLQFGSDAEAQGDGLGALIENPALKTTLISRVTDTENISLFGSVEVLDHTREASGVTINTAVGAFTARLLVAADGRDSVTRRKAGITVQRHDYGASSLVTTLRHSLPHDGLAWQRIIHGGAVALLPLKGNRSQLVWSGPTASIEAATQLPDADFLSLLSEKMDAYLGDMTLEAPCDNYPLRLQVADGFTAQRLVLVGEAGHTIHPLAGQGLNLGLKDAAALAHGVKAARDTGQDIGVASLLDYNLWRNADTRAFGGMTHFISEISNVTFPPLQHLRRLGLSLVDQSTGLKSALQAQASGGNRDLPMLMRARG